jgi:hypothetical protein
VKRSQIIAALGDAGIDTCTCGTQQLAVLGRDQLEAVEQAVKRPMPNSEVGGDQRASLPNRQIEPRLLRLRPAQSLARFNLSHRS